MNQLSAAIEPDRHRREVRLAVGAREYPRTLILGGAVLLIFRGITVVLTKIITPESEVLTVDITYLTMGATLFGLGLLLRTDAVPLDRRPWIFAFAAVLMAVGLYINFLADTTPLNFAVILLLLTTCGAATLAWTPFLVEAVLMLSVGLLVLIRCPIGQTLEWFMLTVGATALGAILLQVRLRTVYELADATAETERLATTDQLTGLLNRRGLMTAVAPLWSTSNGQGTRIFVVFVDIRQLKLANDRYGHEFGDRAIQAAGRAVQASVRTGDLVARWGGDEILVIGLGRQQDAEAFATRLESQTEWTGEDKAKWPGELSVGFAEADPAIDSVDGAISRADHDMYRRRQGR